MFGVIYLPQFHLHAAVPALQEPAAVLESGVEQGKARVLQANAGALDAGVELGMTATRAQARCAAIHLHDRSPEGEAALRERLLHGAERFSPDFEDTAPGLATIDLLGVPQLDPQAFGDRLRQVLPDVRTVCGLAGTPDLALLAARVAAAQQRPALLISEGVSEAAEFLRDLPVRALDPPPDVAEVLRLWGIQTCGELAALPKAEAGERLGPEGATLRILAGGGGRRRLLRLVKEPASFIRSAEIEGGAETTEPVLFLLRRLLESLVARLLGAYLVAGELRLRLAFEDGGSYERILRVPDPCADVDLLFRIMDTHLEGVGASAPVVAVHLEVVPARAGRHQRSLFSRSLRDPNRFAETLARLESMAGLGKVGSPALADTYRPGAFHVREFRELVPEDRDSRNDGDDGAPVRIGLPLRRFRPRLAAEVECLENSSVPARIRCGFEIRGSIRRSHGPWFGSGDWWESETRWQREEWDVEMTSENGTYRLAREGEAWYVEGRYG